MTDLEYIKKFSKISIKKVCQKLKIDYANVMSGKTTADNITKVRKHLESEYAKLYIIDGDKKCQKN